MFGLPRPHHPPKAHTHVGVCSTSYQYEASGRQKLKQSESSRVSRIPEYERTESWQSLRVPETNNSKDLWRPRRSGNYYCSVLASRTSVTGVPEPEKAKSPQVVGAQGAENDEYSRVYRVQGTNMSERGRRCVQQQRYSPVTQESSTFRAV